MEADVLIIGGGVAGLSTAAALTADRRVVVLEAEESVGYHASGRSATFSHFGIGNDTVRQLTAESRSFLAAEGHVPPLSRAAPALFIATGAMLPALDDLHAVMAPHAPNLSRCTSGEMLDLFPPLRPGVAVAGLLDPDGLRLDAALLLQHCARAIRAGGGAIVTGVRAERIHHRQGSWTVASSAGEYRAPILINAAGAWADMTAQLAGVSPLGLTPLRRTIILVEPPAGQAVRGWPFVKTVVDDFYILPEGARLAASAVDEVASDPCDAQPEDYDVALAAAKVEEYTVLELGRIAHRWAGLRTFAPDRTPVVGFDPRAEGFFWLAGQGGFGLQTAPALAEAAAALVTGGPWPSGLARRGVHAHQLAPERLIHV